MASPVGGEVADQARHRGVELVRTCGVDAAVSSRCSRADLFAIRDGRYQPIPHANRVPALGPGGSVTGVPPSPLRRCEASRAAGADDLARTHRSVFAILPADQVLTVPAPGSRHAGGLPTSGQHGEAEGRSRQALRQRGASLDQVLAVVHN